MTAAMESKSATTVDIDAHAYGVETAGYTVIPNQLDPDDISVLRDRCDEAMRLTRAILDSGKTLSLTYSTPDYDGCRAMYCWGEAFVRLIEHETVHALATRMMVKYRLWDMIALSARPLGPDPSDFKRNWHRDFTGLAWGSAVPGFLNCLFCLDDVTAENGGTWLIPGSHRRPTANAPAETNEQLWSLGTGVQVQARAGDLFVLNPTTLHCVGRNNTKRPRRFLGMSICHADLPPLLDHWAIIGGKIRQSASERMKMMLMPPAPPPKSWDLLPPGWRTE